MVNPRAWLAEAIATFGLVFFGPLSVILSVVVFGDGLSIESIIMISLGHGAIIAPIIWNKMYPIPFLTSICFVIIIGIVTAGLICAPEICPNA